MNLRGRGDGGNVPSEYDPNAYNPDNPSVAPPHIPMMGMMPMPHHPMMGPQIMGYQQMGMSMHGRDGRGRSGARGGRNGRGRGSHQNQGIRNDSNECSRRLNKSNFQTSDTDPRKRNLPLNRCLDSSSACD